MIEFNSNEKREMKRLLIVAEEMFPQRKPFHRKHSTPLIHSALSKSNFSAKSTLEIAFILSKCEKKSERASEPLKLFNQLSCREFMTATCDCMSLAEINDNNLLKTTKYIVSQSYREILDGLPLQT